MGAINNAFNQAAGAVAGAGLAIKHAKETEESKVNSAFSKMNSADNSALIARNQARAATAEANEATNESQKEGGLVDQLSEAEVKEDEANKAFEKAINRKNGSPVTRLEKMTELRAAQKAADELRDKYQALTDIQDRAKEQRMYAAKANKIALDEKAMYEKEKAKFEKHWGGK